MSEQPSSPGQVRAELSELARPVAHELRRSLVQRETRRLAGLAGPALLFPVVYLSLVALAALVGVDLRLSWPAVIGLALVAPVVRIFVRWQGARQQQVTRAAALAAIDRAEQLQDRLTTADEFVELPEPDGFQLAAIRDAQRHIVAARSARPSQPALAPESARSLSLASVVAVLLLWCSAWIEVALPTDPVVLDGEQQVIAVVDQSAAQPEELDSLPKAAPRPPSQRNPRQSKQDASSAVSAEDEAPSDAIRRGKNPMGSGRSAEARAAAGGGSERGQPSNQAQSTKGDPSSKPKPKKKKKDPKKDLDQAAEEEAKPPQQSGSTLGRGSGKGSSKSPTASPWSAKDQVVSDEEEDLEDDEEVDDENDESRARGGVQPNLRQRKPPVNRDLQISMGSGKPQDDANGRGGPGGPKKQRGVAQLVLGVTFPDHISAEPNPGMSKITQERIEPQAQQGDSINGEDRGARAAPMGHLSRRVLSPWMQDLVRSFYLGLRKEGGPQ